MHKLKDINLNTGLTLVEVLIATSIILTFLVTLFGVHNIYLKTVSFNVESVKAIYLAEEGLEVVRFLRDSSWTDNISTLALDTDYYLVFESGTWQTTSTNTLIDDTYDRTITLSEVYRDASGDIVSSGGTLDQETKLVTSSVSWENRSVTSTKFVSTYIVNLFNN